MFEEKKFTKGCAVKIVKSDRDILIGLVGLVKAVYMKECAIDFGMPVYSGYSACDTALQGEGLILCKEDLEVITLDEMTETDRIRILALIAYGDIRKEKQLKIYEVDNEIETLRCKIKTLKEEREQLEQYINNYIELYKKRQAITNDVTKHSKVRKGGALENENGFYFITTPIIAEASNGGKYALGEFRVDVTLDDNNITIFNVKLSNARKGYWSDTDVHPHIRYDGNACFGYVQNIIISFLTESEYYFAVDAIISFLEQINLNDSAGQFAMNWDRIDEDGNITPGKISYSAEHFFYDEDNHLNDKFSEEPYVECENCGDRVPYDEIMELDGEYYCTDCVEDCTMYCEYCDEHHLEDKFITVKTGESICEYELENNYCWCDECGEYVHEDDWVGETEMCNDCTEEKYKYCEGCGKYVDISDFIDETGFCYDCTAEEHTYCNECDGWVENSFYDFDKDMCNDCVESEYAKCDGCGEYVNKFDIEPLPNGLYVCPDCMDNYNDKQEETREI